MARTKQTARKSTGGEAPRRRLDKASSLGPSGAFAIFKTLHRRGSLRAYQGFEDALFYCMAGLALGALVSGVSLLTAVAYVLAFYFCVARFSACVLRLMLGSGPSSAVSRARLWALDMFWLYGTDGKPEAEELPGEGHLLSWDESFCFKTSFTQVPFGQSGDMSRVHRHAAYGSRRCLAPDRGAQSRAGSGRAAQDGCWGWGARGDGAWCTRGQVRYCLVSPPPSKVLGVALPARGTVVLLHGVSMTCDVWAPYLRALADAGWAVLTYDMWGHGDSAVPRDVELTPGLLAAQLADLLDELCLTGPVHVVGFSLGCYIGALFAANCSARAASVSFLAPAAGFNSAAVNDNDFTGRNAVLNLLAKGLRVYKGFPLVARLVSPWGGFVLRCMARAAGPTRQQLAGLCYAQTRAMSVSRCSSPLSAAVQQVWGYVNALRFLAASWLWQHARSPREGVLKSIVCHGEILSSDTTPMLRRLAAARLPTLLVFGSEDPLVPDSVVRRCESLFHHAHVCEVKAGHNLVLHALPQVRQALLTFLDQM